jgi:hypothetical protein
MTTATKNGPGPQADISHRALIARLIAICTERGVPFRTGVPIGETPFGQSFKADLCVDLPGFADLVIIARYQDQSGSAEQKLPFLVMAITRTRRPVLVVLDGAGWSQGALDWMAERKGDRVIDTVDLDGFDAFLVAALRG